MTCRVLLLGAGSSTDLVIRPVGADEDVDITTLDVNPAHKPDVMWDLNWLPWPPKTGLYDEVHAYEIFEHLGRQGDAHAFFDTFEECWRLLRPGGYLIGTVPQWNSVWAWGDPSHTRVISAETLFFLDQTNYAEVGQTPMSDFRGIWKGDFETMQILNQEHRMGFMLQAHKPARSVT